MKINFNKHFLQLLVISGGFFLISLLGTAIAPVSLGGFFGQSGDDEIILILLLLPIYIFWVIFEASLGFLSELYLVKAPLISAIIILLSAVFARFLFNPKNGYFTGFRFFTVLGYTIAKITAVLYSIAFSLAVPSGIIITLPLIIGFFVFCKNQINDVEDIKSSDKLSHFTELAYNCDAPAILCDKDMIIHTSNSYADRLYKSYDSPEIMGRCFCSFLSDDEAQKLRSCAEILSENSSFDRLIVTYTEDNTPDLTVTAVRFKNRRLVGFLIKHE